MKHWVGFSGETVLQILVDNSGLTWRELQKELGMDRITSGAGEMALYYCLLELADACLLSIDGIPDEEVPSTCKRALQYGMNETKFRASDSWRKVQMALNHVQFGPTKPQPDYTMTVNPIFGKPSPPPQQMDLFVLMPFALETRAIYTDHIKKVGELLGLSVSRADDFFTSNSIMFDVWSGINGAGAIIADCTDRNPNVFYELGIAHALGKPVILVTRNQGDVPADLRHIKYINYEYTPRGMETFEKALAMTIEQTLGLYR